MTSLRLSCWWPVPPRDGGGGGGGPCKEHAKVKCKLQFCKIEQLWQKECSQTEWSWLVKLILKYFVYRQIHRQGYRQIDRQTDRDTCYILSSNAAPFQNGMPKNNMDKDSTWVSHSRVMWLWVWVSREHLAKTVKTAAMQQLLLVGTRHLTQVHRCRLRRILAMRRLCDPQKFLGYAPFLWLTSGRQLSSRGGPGMPEEGQQELRVAAWARGGLRKGAEGSCLSPSRPQGGQQGAEGNCLNPRRPEEGGQRAAGSGLNPMRPEEGQQRAEGSGLNPRRPEEGQQGAEGSGLNLRRPAEGHQGAEGSRLNPRRPEEGRQEAEGSCLSPRRPEKGVRELRVAVWTLGGLRRVGRELRVAAYLRPVAANLEHKDKGWTLVWRVLLGTPSTTIWLQP